MPTTYDDFDFFARRFYTATRKPKPYKPDIEKLYNQSLEKKPKNRFTHYTYQYNHQHLTHTLSDTLAIQPGHFIHVNTPTTTQPINDVVDNPFHTESELNEL